MNFFLKMEGVQTNDRGVHKRGPKAWGRGDSLTIASYQISLQGVRNRYDYFEI